MATVGKYPNNYYFCTQRSRFLIVNTKSNVKVNCKENRQISACYVTVLKLCTVQRFELRFFKQ